MTTITIFLNPAVVHEELFPQQELVLNHHGILALKQKVHNLTNQSNELQHRILDTANARMVSVTHGGNFSDVILTTAQASLSLFEQEGEILHTLDATRQVLAMASGLEQAVLTGQVPP